MKLPQQALGGYLLLRRRGRLRRALSVAAFQHLVGLQGQLQQAHQRFHPFRLFQEDRAHCQRGFALMMQQFHVALLLVLREQLVLREERSAVVTRTDRPS